MKSPSATSGEPRATRKRPDARRREVRDGLWADAGSVVWSRHEAKGFSTVPRLLCLATQLLRIVGCKNDPSSVLFELWLRTYDESFVEVKSEEELAYASGYLSQRAVRSWAERVEELEDRGFVRIQSSGVRKHAFILLLDPIRASAELFVKVYKGAKGQQRAQLEAWRAAFVARASDVGAELPDSLQLTSR